MIETNNKKGFVALFTVLITSVILAMALGIASISLKEIVLSSAASEGSNAFYAADSGIECALYFDRVNNAPESFFDNMICNNTSLSQAGACSNCEFNIESYEFNASFGQDNELCAFVTVERGIPGAFNTRIESKGSNVSCDDNTNPKRVERSIRVTY